MSSSNNNDPIIQFIDNAINEIKIAVIDILKMLAIGILLFSLIGTITSTPTTSMYPTVKKGDTLILSKFLYGFNFHSFDMGPFGISHNSFWKNLFTYMPQKKIFNLRGVKRGDIIGFRINSDLRTCFLKRVIGVAGDTIQMKQGVLYINKIPVKKEFIREKIQKKKRTKKHFMYYKETLPNGISYTVRYLKGYENTYANNTGEEIIAPGFVFGIGDNRDMSDDSRGNIGFIPVENITGKASMIIFAKGGELELFTLDLKKMIKSFVQLPRKIKWKRFGTLL